MAVQRSCDPSTKSSAYDSISLSLLQRLGYLGYGKVASLVGRLVVGWLVLNNGGVESATREVRCMWQRSALLTCLAPELGIDLRLPYDYSTTRQSL